MKIYAFATVPLCFQSNLIGPDRNDRRRTCDLEKESPRWRDGPCSYQKLHRPDRGHLAFLTFADHDGKADTLVRRSSTSRNRDICTLAAHPSAVFQRSSPQVLKFMWRGVGT